MAYRPLLLEWICDVCMELELTPETLHTAVYLLDSFMFKQKLGYPFLQVLSCACILVAGKQEEREENVPGAEELVYLCRQSFSCETLVTMEKILLEVLEWNILTCNVIHFIRFFLFQWCQQCNDKLQKSTYGIKSQAIGELALYLANRAMIDKNCFLCSPSCLAAASVYCVLFGLFGEPFVEDACSLHILWTDDNNFFGEYISKQVELFQPWFVEKQLSQTATTPIRLCSPTSIQEMLSFNHGGHCTSFC
ncbi:Cyclin-A2 [Galdieria sulphuraria]|nr:Cyclin-A2 [Galdieria sulphuraria]